ncbi:hypothetical protein KY289_008985 [Solanum tuberosum]|nr:hypothetical protein KY289_008985 [Solanum tuberosum]
MKKAREFPSQWDTISLVLGRTTQSYLDRHRILIAKEPKQFMQLDGTMLSGIDFSKDWSDELPENSKKQKDIVEKEDKK